MLGLIGYRARNSYIASNRIGRMCCWVSSYKINISDRKGGCHSVCGCWWHVKLMVLKWWVLRWFCRPKNYYDWSLHVQPKTRKHELVIPLYICGMEYMYGVPMDFFVIIKMCSLFVCVFLSVTVFWLFSFVFLGFCFTLKIIFKDFNVLMLNAVYCLLFSLFTVGSYLVFLYVFTL